MHSHGGPTPVTPNNPVLSSARGVHLSAIYTWRAGNGPVFALELFPVVFDIARRGGDAGQTGLHRILPGVRAVFNNNGTPASAVSLRFTLELLYGLKQPARHLSPDLGIFHHARFSAADFGPPAHPDHLPQLIDFFWKDTEPIGAATAM